MVGLLSGSNDTIERLERFERFELNGVTPIHWTVKGQKLEYRSSEFWVDSFSLR